MSDFEQSNDEALEAAAFDALKARADQLGVSYHPSISAAKLSAKVKAHLEKYEETDEEMAVKPATAVRETPGQKAKRIKDEALALVRVNVVCMDPQKTEWDGEIFTVGNSIIPTQRKYVPFNTKDGYHIPKIMYDMLVARECQVFYTEKVNGLNIRRGKQIPAFNIVVLPPLTKGELADLAASQAASGVIA